MASKINSKVKSFFDDEADGDSDTSAGSEGDEPNEYDHEDPWVDNKAVKDRRSARSLAAAEDAAEDAEAEALARHYMAKHGEDEVDDDEDDDDDDEVTGRLDPVMQEMAEDLKRDEAKTAAEATAESGPTSWGELEKTVAVKDKPSRRGGGGGGGRRGGGGAAKTDGAAEAAAEMKEAFKDSVSRHKLQMHLKIKGSMICSAPKSLNSDTVGLTSAQLRDALTEREDGEFCRRDVLGFYLDEGRPRAFLDMKAPNGTHIYLFVAKDMHRRLWPAEHIDALRGEFPLLSKLLRRMAGALESIGEASVLAWDTLLKQGERCPLVRRDGDKIVPRFDAVFLLDLIKSEAARPVESNPSAPAAAAVPAPEAGVEAPMDTKEAAAVANHVVQTVDKTVARAKSDFAEEKAAAPADPPAEDGEARAEGTTSAKKKSKARASAASRLSALMENVVTESKRRSGHTLMAMKIADDAKVVYFREDGVTDAEEIARTVKAIKRFSKSHDDFTSNVPYFITADPMPMRVGLSAAPAGAQAQTAPPAAPRPATTSRYMTSTTADAARAKAVAAAAQKAEADIGRWIVLRGSSDYELMERMCKQSERMPGGLRALDREGICDIMDALKDMPMKTASDLKTNMQAVANEHTFVFVNVLLALASVFTIRDEPGLEDRMPMIASMMKGSDPAGSLASKAGFVYEKIAANAREKASQNAGGTEPVTKAIRAHATGIFNDVREAEEKVTTAEAQYTELPITDTARQGLLIFYSCFIKK